MSILAYAAGNTSGLNGELFAGFVVGIFFLGFIWLVVAAARTNKENFHEYYYNGILYTTRRSHRLLGENGERVTTDGQWVQWVKSLWRTYYDRWTKKHYFFLLIVDELNPARVIPVSEDKAKQWISEHADAEHAQKLIREWFSGEQQTKTKTVHH